MKQKLKAALLVGAVLGLCVQTPVLAAQAKKAEQPEKKPVLVDVIRLFAPESTYTLPGYTHEEVVEIMTTGRWKELGWEVIIS